MPQLKKDEWPDDGERTTTENQVLNQAPAPADTRPRPAPDTPPPTEDDDDLSNTRPEEAID